MTKAEETQLKNSFIENNNALFALTTVDNPYNPFTQFGDWFMYDVEQGYNTCSYLARIAKTSDSLSDTENNEEIERSIDEIIKNDLQGIYLKVRNKNYVGFLD